MSTFASSSSSKKSKERGKPQGWAAFDLKQRQKQPLVVGGDPFPPLPISSTTTSRNLPMNARSFSSVVIPSADFPPIAENADCNTVLDSSLIEVPGGASGDFALDKLQRLHCWSDKSLIEVVMATVNNDVEKATTLLKEIVPCADSMVNRAKKEISDCLDSQCIEGELGKTSHLAADIAELSSTLEDALKELKNMHTAHGKRLSEAATATMKLILGHLKYLPPVEPECEDDDVYWSHRRNALRMMRLASRHSRAATNAFIRGDHFSAQQQSLKARKEWLDAERLNAKAAKEILSLRNSEDNPWKLDLHGLHAAEAVQALEGHLKKIETQLPLNWQSSSIRVMRKNGVVCSSNPPFATMDIYNRNINCTGFHQRHASLQVITGVGNHSRGQAALPAAVRNFLVENSYHFEETRPGVISVCPRFHHR